MRTADGELVRAAAREVPPAELVVVGDADQSIYAFRGATIRNIVEFERDYPDARTIMLEQNYRSTQTILSAANSVIARNPQRRAKNLWTAQGGGTRIIGYVGDNEHDEAQFVGKEIDPLVDAGEAVFGDVAVFYRTNSASRSMEDVFIRTGMPYRIVGGVRFYERKEVKDALAYLRAIANPDDEINLRRILNTPRRGIGDRAEACVSVFAERERIGFGEALQRVARSRDWRRGRRTRCPRSRSCWPACGPRSGSAWSRPTCSPRCWSARDTARSWRTRRTRRTGPGWRTWTSWSPCSGRPPRTCSPAAV